LVRRAAAATRTGGALRRARAGPAANKARLSLEAPAELPLLYGDRIQLQQVILNLVRNAIDALAGRSDGAVQVVARRLDAPAGVQIGVADNGPGIDAALAGRLFEPLMTSKRDGLGLGLSICASIVQLHGGRIWLHSGAAGATEFRVSLPARSTA